MDILRLKIKEDENRIALLITENERLNTLNYEQATEIKKLIHTADQSAKDKQKDIDEVKVKIETEINARHNVRVANYENQIRILKEDIAKLEALIRSLHEEITRNERRIQALLEDNVRQSDLSVQRLREIDELKKRFNITVNQALSSVKDGNPMNSKGLTNADVQEVALRYETEKKSMEQQIEQLKTFLDQSRNEIAKLRDLYETKKREFDQLTDYADGQEDKVYNTRKLEEELKLVKEQYEQAKKECEQLRATRDLYRRELEAVSNKNIEDVTTLVRETIKPTDRDQKNKFSQIAHLASQKHSSTGNRGETVGPSAQSQLTNGGYSSNNQQARKTMF